MIIRVGEGERVVSVERLADMGSDDVSSDDGGEVPVITPER
jgi:hypothetical protein